MVEKVDVESGDLTPRLLDVSQVNIVDLVTFEHPKLAKARREVLQMIDGQQVVAGFGSAI